LVYSPAVPESNIERVEARNRGIRELSYPEILGEISKEKTTIAISGTNGKTTTTSMVTELFKHLGLDPMAIVGEYLQKYDSNFIAGQSEYLITEACEYRGSFLNIYPDILVITNITEDHLDYFKDLAHIQEIFSKLLENLKGVKTLICNTSLPNLQPVIEHAKELGITVVPYEPYLEQGIELSVPGQHNLENAAAALAVIASVGESTDQAKTYLAHEFQGAKRRMEYVGLTEGGAHLFDDYAHNPEGLERLIGGLRSFYADKKIVLMFEPHLYSRTRDFKETFGKELSKADIVYLFPTYRAREPENPDEDFLLKDYIDENQVELHTVDDTETFLKGFSTAGYGHDTVVVTVGAGPIWKVGLKLKKS